MRILIACEFSGIVRDAFRAKGHEAWSCDLLPGESVSPYHFEGSVEWVLKNWPDWDMLIGHPPCTYLSNSGARWLYGGKGNVIDKARWAKMEAGAQFFKLLLNCNVPRIAIENPVIHRHAMAIIGQRHTQTIQPWQYGHGEIKRTCLWLKNLPKLTPTNIVAGRKPRVHFASPGPKRWKERSRTLPGIAAAMADQWSKAETFSLQTISMLCRR